MEEEKSSDSLSDENSSASGGNEQRNRARTEIVGGDKIGVGDVEGQSAVAVGRGAKASIFNIDIRLLPLVIGLVILVGALAYFLLKPEDKPQVMDKDYNVAIAEFLVQDENGQQISSAEGKKFGDWLHGRLEKNLDQVLNELYDGTFLIWPPEYTGVITGATPQEREANAEARAKEINANVIIYGALEPKGSQSSTGIEFFVNHESFDEGADIKGRFLLGGPLSIDNPFVQGSDIVTSIPLSARAEGLSLLAIGLAYYAIDDFSNAIKYFSEANNIEKWLESKGTGKHVVKLLLGNAFVRKSSKDKDPQLLPTAQAYYDEAYDLDNEYARAIVGLAGVNYLLALGDPSDSEINLELLAAAEAGFEEALQIEDPPESANVPTKVDFGLGQVYLLRHVMEGGDWLDESIKKFARVIQEYEGGNEQIEDIAAHAYARMGLIEDVFNHEPQKAIANYKEAAELTSPFYRGEYNGRLGDLYSATCELDLAADAYKAALQAAEVNGDGEKYTEYGEKLSALSAIDLCGSE